MVTGPPRLPSAAGAWGLEWGSQECSVADKVLGNAAHGHLDLPAPPAPLRTRPARSPAPGGWAACCSPPPLRAGVQSPKPLGGAVSTMAFLLGFGRASIPMPHRVPEMTMGSVIS